MLQKLKQLSILFLTLTISSTLWANPVPAGNQPQTLVHILDYIAQDYHNAVQNGEIINENEYTEMLEFSQSARNLYPTIRIETDAKTDSTIKANLNILEKLVINKSNFEEVSSVARSIRKEVIRITGMKIAPNQWPNLATGKNLFAKHCQSCHGINGKGDGPLSAGLEPAPSNFHTQVMEGMSPFQVYNTVRLGLDGTAMRAFTELTEQEVWDISNYVISLRYQSTKKAKTQFEGLDKLTLEDVSSLSDDELAEKLCLTKANRAEVIATIRMNRYERNHNASLIIARGYLNEAKELYAKGEKSEALNSAMQAYFEGIEPIEPKIKTLDQGFTYTLEQKMMKVRTDISLNSPESYLDASVNEALQAIDQAEKILETEKTSYWSTFFFSISILLREGLEAFLVIIIIISVIRSAKANKALKWVHYGWLSALLLGIISWVFVDYLISLGANKIELIEGIASIVAVGMLLYVGFWLHSKTEISKWKDFVNNKIKKLVESQNLLGLSALSFIVVFREAFESVVFLSAINIESGQQHQSAILLGFLGASAIVMVFAYLFVKVTRKLPIRQILRYSAFVLGILAIVLAGKGIFALQKTGAIPTSPLNIDIDLSFIGFYPNVQVLVAQLLILVSLVFITRYAVKKEVPSNS